MRRNKFLTKKDSFTLVELLVVIGILAILTAAVVIVLNPAELLKQSRDSKRTTDLANLNNAIKLLLTQSPDVNLGSASTVYVSLSDSSSTCGSYSLAPLPAGWKYQCATAANYQKTDGTGWIPVSFAAAGGVASLPSLPADPQNTVQNYYSYVAGGSWQLATVFESAKYADKEAGDGGANPAGYEVGSNLSLAPFLGGLVGSWDFDETSGITAYDKSGYGNNGNMWAGTVPTFINTQSGCRKGWCLNPDGINKAAVVPHSPSLDLSGTEVSITAWISPTASSHDVVSKSSAYGMKIATGNPYCLEWDTGNDWTGTCYGSITRGSWVFLATTMKNGIKKWYINGQLAGTKSVSGVLTPNGADVWMGCDGACNSNENFTGLIDEVRVYNRGLSDSEISAIYDTTK